MRLIQLLSSTIFPMPRVSRRLQGLEPSEPEPTGILNSATNDAVAAMPLGVLGLPTEIWALVADQVGASAVILFRRSFAHISQAII